MSQVGCFSLSYTSEAHDMCSRDPENRLQLSVPVQGARSEESIKKKELAFEHYRSAAHVKWVCIERDGELLTPPKRPVSAATDTELADGVALLSRATDLPQALLRFSGTSPANARPRSRSNSFVTPGQNTEEGVMCIE